MLNPEFQRDFINRFADLLNTVLLPTNTLAHIDGFAAALAPEMAEHCQRWLAPASLADWQNAVEYLREYARRRPDFCRQHLKAHFNLPGTTRLTLAVDPPSGGGLRLNTLELSFTNQPTWQGTYFLGNPVRLTARPEPGYRFVGWSGLAGVTTNSVQLMLQGDWNLTARFARTLPMPARLEIQSISGGNVELSLSAAPETRWTLESSSDLRTWSTVDTVTVSAQGTGATALPIEKGAGRYYRARQP
jgi:uncharacterized repeat protein (TIGR02543 family)